MVVKFNPRGRVAMVFGRKQEASDEETGPLKHPSPPRPAEDGRFRQVTDVTWDPAGNTFISDGYINSRVAKVDSSGNWLKSWGDRGNKPGEFHTPHSIAADARGNIYVADRGNRRIQVFDGDGALLREIRIDVPYDPAARPAIGNRPDLYKLSLEGKVLGVFGESGKQLKQFGWIHEIACPSENLLYVAELLNWRVQKLILH